MDKEKWGDDSFLDGLRAATDPLADAAVERLVAENGIEAANAVFKGLHADETQLPADTPAPLREFLAQTGELPANLDHERIRRGAHAFLQHSAGASLVLLASSLPQGYASPALCRILSISGDLETHPYKRLLGVIQLLVNISSPGAWQPGGLAVVTAQKLRLLHAGVRLLAARHRPHYAEIHGPPVNHEDMLATIMAFSWLVIDGFRTLDIDLGAEEDFYYLWRNFALLMGIHPPGRPEDPSLVPEDIDAASRFYRAYARRQFAMPAQNPEGPVLANVNLAMMQHLIPPLLRKLGFDRVPRIAMTELLSDEALARVGMAPAKENSRFERFLGGLLRGANRLVGRLPHVSAFLGWLIFRDMIREGRGGEVSFIIPDSLESLRGPGLV